MVCVDLNLLLKGKIMSNKKLAKKIGKKIGSPVGVIAQDMLISPR